MDWVHCNFCFSQPTKDKRFLLTNCGHLFCSSCLEKGPNSQCLTCKAPCTTIGLSAKMRPDIEQYFSDALDVLKKQQKMIIQVLEFQKKHRDRYIAHLKEHGQGDLGKRHRQLMERTSELEKENQMFRVQMMKTAAIEKENQMLRTELQRLTGRPVELGKATGMIPAQSPIGNARIGTGSSGPVPPMRTPTLHQSSQMPAAMQRTIQRQESATPRPPSGPKRILVRTPPVNGKMGYIPSPTGRQTASQGMVHHGAATGSTQHSQGRCITTPSPSYSQSPMSFSPAGPAARTMQSSQSQIGHYYTPSMMVQQPTPSMDGYKQPSSAGQFGRPRTPR